MSAGTHMVTFPEGSQVAELKIPILDDKLLELDEVFFVEIISSDSEVNGGRKITQVVILNNDGMYVYCLRMIGKEDGNYYINTYHTAGECRRQVKNLTNVVKNVKIA